MELGFFEKVCWTDADAPTSIKAKGLGSIRQIIKFFNGSLDVVEISPAHYPHLRGGEKPAPLLKSEGRPPKVNRPISREMTLVSRILPAIKNGITGCVAEPRCFARWSHASAATVLTPVVQQLGDPGIGSRRR